MKRLSCLPVLLLASVPAAAGQPLKIAILDLATPGIAEDQAAALRTSLIGTLAAEVSSLGHNVISSADINAMLSFERQRDLLACQDDTACLSEIGGALGADLILSGSVGRLGDTFTLSLTLIDIRRVEAKMRFQGNAGTEEALATTAARGARELFGEAPAVGGTGTLLVKTEPAGGVVSLDGREIGPAPVTIDEVPVGEHVITATRGEGRGRVALRLTGEAIERVTVVIAAAPPVKLKVLSTPPEARVFLDDADVGVTPLLLADVPSGEHQLRITARDHRTHEERLTLSHAEFEAGGGAPLKVEVTLAAHMESSVPFGVAVGPIADGLRPGDGTGLSAELFFAPLVPFVDSLDWLELTFGLVVPMSVAPGLRFWFLQTGVEAGAVLKWAFYSQMRTGFWSFAPGLGLCLGRSFELPVGKGGVRLETTLHYAANNYEHVTSPWTLPITLAVWWGL